MKKYLTLSFLLILALLSISYGQIQYGFGLKLGPNVSKYEAQVFGNIRSENGYEYDNSLGFQCLFFGELLVQKYLGLIIETGYLQSGFDNSDVYPNKVYEFKNFLQYLMFQFAFKLQYPMNSVRPYLITGFVYSYLFKKHIETWYPYGIKLPFYPFNNHNFSLNAGIGSELFYQNNISILIEIRNKFDLNPVFEDDFKTEVKNKYSFQFLIGIIFKNRKE